jgi:hypothetical protein
MNSTTPKISPLRQRMIEDMRLRKLATSAIARLTAIKVCRRVWGTLASIDA